MDVWTSFYFCCRSIYLAVARSEAERAGPEGQTFRQPPRKQVGSSDLRRRAISALPVLGAPGSNPQVCTAPATTIPAWKQPGAGPRPCAGLRLNIFPFPPCTAQKVNCRTAAREAPLEGFLFDVSKRKWGVHPRAAKRRTPPCAPPGAHHFGYRSASRWTISSRASSRASATMTAPQSRTAGTQLAGAKPRAATVSMEISLASSPAQ